MLNSTRAIIYTNETMLNEVKLKDIEKKIKKVVKHPLTKKLALGLGALGAAALAYHKLHNNTKQIKTATC